MTLNLALGAIACVLGVGLLAGNTYFMRMLFEGQQDQLRKPPIRSMWEHTQSQTPRWMRSDRYRKTFIRLWLLGVAGMLLWVGVELIQLGT